MHQGFTAEDISEFCRITGDNNRIHVPEEMHSHGKKAIVPGMLSFAAAAYCAGDFITTANYVMVLFNRPLSEGELFDPKITYLFDKPPREVRFDLVPEGRDLIFQGNCIFSKKIDLTNDWYSCMRKYRSTGWFKKNVREALNIEGRTCEYNVGKKSINALAEILARGNGERSAGTVNHGAAYSDRLNRSQTIPLLCCIAYSSMPLLDNFSFASGTMPVYESMELYLFPQRSPIEPETLSFRCKVIQEDKRNYKAYVACAAINSSQRAELYAGTYKLKLFPEQVLMKMVAKDL